jgi:hypothetical protein
MLSSCGVDDSTASSWSSWASRGESEAGAVLDKAEPNAENRGAPGLDVSADDIDAAVHEAEEEPS